MSPARRRAPRPRVLEKSFQDTIVELAHLGGWKVAHFRPARVSCRGCKGAACPRCKGTGQTWRTPVEADGKGFPDLVMVHGGRGIGVALECKREREKATEEQCEWILDFRAAGFSAAVVQPSDWPWIEWVLTKATKKDLRR